MNEVQLNNYANLLLLQLFVIGTPEHRIDENNKNIIESVGGDLPFYDGEWGVVYDKLLDDGLIDLVDGDYVTTRKGQAYVIKNNNKGRGINLAKMARFKDSNPTGRRTSSGFKAAGLLEFGKAFVEDVQNDVCKPDASLIEVLQKLVNDLSTICETSDTVAMVATEA